MINSLNDLLKGVKGLTYETGDYIRQQVNNVGANKIETKGTHDFVTVVDKESERRLVEGLTDLLPGAGFITEEGTTKKADDTLNWIIDPIDGTTNFIHGSPPFAISIGLKKNNEMVLGVIYEIMADEMFSAYTGGGAYLNDTMISVSDAPTIKDSLIATGFPYTNFSRLAGFIETFQYLMKHSHGLRRLGSAATDLAYVACGRYDGFYEYGLKPWDVAAGICILKEAGGAISDFNGGDDYIFGGEIVASNGKVQREFVEVIGKLMNS
jgi:myo-inositol-1(or 4)-monophosphatase